MRVKTRKNRRQRATYKSGCAVSPEGDSITLKLTDESGKSCALVLTFDEASSLAMTLPRLLGMALRQKYSDDALRHVYALRGYAVECASDGRHLIVILETDSEFDIAFAIRIETVTAIASDLASGVELLAESRPILSH
jgi:hypothetical protein